jgi:hypothetical protein
MHRFIIYKLYINLFRTSQKTQSESIQKTKRLPLLGEIQLFIVQWINFMVKAQNFWTLKPTENITYGCALNNYTQEIEWPRNLGFIHSRGEIFLSSPLSEVPWAQLASCPSGKKSVLSPGVQRPEHEPAHSHPCISEGTNAWSYTSIRPYSVAVWCWSRRTKMLFDPVTLMVEKNT